MTTRAPPVSACVVNYNGEHYLARCLEALHRTDGVDEIIVADDASTDRSVELVRECFPSARVLELPRNRGPAAARNAAFRAARNDQVLFVDNDVYVPADIATQLGRALEAYPSAAIAVPRLVRCAAPEVVQFDGAEAHFLGTHTLLHADTPLSSAPIDLRTTDTSMVSACFVIDRHRWGTGDPFDESFFMYLEDHEFGFRCRALGFRIVSVPAVQCLHDSGTLGISIRQMGTYSAVRVRGLIENRWQVLVKGYQPRTLIVLGPLLLLYELAQLALVLRKGWLRHWSASVRSIAGRFPDLWKRRRELQRRRTVADRDILRGGSLPFTGHLATTGAQRAAQRVLDGAARWYWHTTRRLI
ncbi:MAG TPA: glycosyltransferase family 2 protein [Gemmatimonadaceae bacterium]|nr:glycosyltransferase family 2 protein [Gemmatimonadaceae bacterium]